MFFKRKTLTYAICCILATVMRTAEGNSSSMSQSVTIEDGYKITRTQIDGGEVKETRELIRLRVTEYYETLSADSRKFFKDLFQPNYLEFREYVEFTLVPWGLSEITPDDKIKCPQGEDECTGNKYQACAIKLGDTEEDQLKYSSCVMTTDGIEAYTSCGQGIANFTEIETCAKGEDGIKFLKEMGEKTKQLQPPLDSVPAMYIEDQPLTADEKNSLWKDFISFMCAKLPSKKPKCCEGRAPLPPADTFQWIDEEECGSSGSPIPSSSPLPSASPLPSSPPPK